MTIHFRRFFPHFPLLWGVSLILFAAPILAEENNDDHCALVSQNIAKTIPLSTIAPDDPSIYLSADNVVSRQSNQFEVQGDVQIQTNQYSVLADKAQYNRQADYLSAQGNISYRKQDIFIESDSLELDLKTSAGKAKNTRYHLLQENTNGIAGEILFKNTELTLQQSTYSTCEGDEKAWQIRAKTIELHPEENEGIARNMRLEIAGTPILYLPYISFPLEGRKSGFLAPRPRYSSNEGFDIAVPYYFNLRPNYDLTLTPRFINTRGAQVGGEFRYLQRSYNGSFGYEILPGDKQADRDRQYLNLKHQQQINENTRFDLFYAQVSDKQYFSDLGTELNTVNKSQLSRGFNGQTHNSKPGQTNWIVNTLVHDYQMLDNNSEPYRRIPQIELIMTNNLGPLQWQNRAQYAYFQKNSNDYLHRAVIMPEVNAKLHREYAYFTPSIGMVASAYQTSSNADRNNQFVNGFLSAKAGLFFERNSENGYQTLTPEIQYSYIPYKNQSALPRVDSSILDYDIDQLFSTQRYSGYDRLGDENRLSWSLSTDYLRKSSQQSLFYARLAQALYLADHQILLPQERAIRKNDLVNAAYLRGKLSKRLSSSLQAYHFMGESQLNNGNISINYKNNHQQAELAYRFRQNLIEQASVVGIIDISPKWRLATRWLYSIRQSRTREALLGLEYNNCCWAIRVMGRQYASQQSTELNTSVGLQIELKGLTRIGSSLDKQFSDEVFGNQ